MREIVSLQSSNEAKEKEINDVVKGTRKELSGFSQMIESIGDGFKSVVEKLQNLWNDIVWGWTAAAGASKLNSADKKQDPFKPAYEYLADTSLEWIDMPQKELFTHFLEYMQHQQGATGTSRIVENIMMGRKLPSNILSNMRNNVGSDFPGGKNKVTGPTFVKYWYKRFVDNYKQFAHKTVPYEDVLDRAAAKYGQPKEILKTIIGIESHGDVYANKGKKSSYKGLMQVDIRQTKQYGVTDIYDPEQNIMMAMELRKQNSRQLNALKDNIPQLIAKVAPVETMSNAA